MDLTNSEWRLTEYGSTDTLTPAASTPATMTFGDDGQVSGSGGCNSFNGPYELGNSQITFGPLVATLRACADDAVTQQESAVLPVLTGDVSYELSDGTLRLLYGDGAALVFTSGASAATTAPSTQAAVVSGTATYRQRIALPPNAKLTVQLLDTSRADAPATTIAEQVITPTGQVPIAFTLAYDPAQIEPRHTYTVRAEIRQGEQLLWTTTTVYPVITNGNPTSVEIVLEQVQG